MGNSLETADVVLTNGPRVTLGASSAPVEAEVLKSAVASFEQLDYIFSTVMVGFTGEGKLSRLFCALTTGSAFSIDILDRRCFFEERCALCKHARTFSDVFKESLCHPCGRRRRPAKFSGLVELSDSLGELAAPLEASFSEEHDPLSYVMFSQAVLQTVRTMADA